MLREKLQHKRIILASGSPRRQQFFSEMDIDFTIQIKEVEEICSLVNSSKNIILEGFMHRYTKLYKDFMSLTNL